MHIDQSSSDLVSSIEEFGLSKYEARAYLTMIGRGSLAASEIAYYANLPRTKVYTTLKKLEKKRLSVISQQKPLICSAIPPEEAFGEIVNLHEKRLKNMRKVVEKLKKVNDEGQRPKGSEERRFFVLDPDATLEKLNNLIGNAKSSIHALLDIWGVRLIAQCKPSLLKAITNSVNIRFVIGIQCVGNESLSVLPEGIEMRIGDVSSNIIIVDSNHMISIDNSNGKAAVFSPMDIFILSQLKNFEDIWSRSFEVKDMAKTEPDVAVKAIQLTRLMENGLSAHMLEHAINSQSDHSGEIMKTIEKLGIKIHTINAVEIFGIIDSALKMIYSGSLKHDRNNNLVSIQSKVDSRPVLPWAFLLALYLKHIGNESKIIHGSKHGSSSEVVHIKLAKPI